MQESWVKFLGQGGTLEKEMATHFKIPAWEIPWTEEPGGLSSMGWQRVRINLVAEHEHKAGIRPELPSQICFVSYF